MAPLTGIAFASNRLIHKLNLNSLVVKTTRMTTIFLPYTPIESLGDNYTLIIYIKIS